MKYTIEADILEMEPDNQQRIGTLEYILKQGRQALICKNGRPQMFFDGERVTRLGKSRDLHEILENIDSPGTRVYLRKGRRKVSINPCDVNGFQNAEKSGEKILNKYDVLVLENFMGKRNLYVAKNNGSAKSYMEIGNGMDLEIYLKHRA